MQFDWLGLLYLLQIRKSICKLFSHWLIGLVTLKGDPEGQSASMYIFRASAISRESQLLS